MLWGIRFFTRNRRLERCKIGYEFAFERCYESSFFFTVISFEEILILIPPLVEMKNVS